MEDELGYPLELSRAARDPTCSNVCDYIESVVPDAVPDERFPNAANLRIIEIAAARVGMRNRIPYRSQTFDSVFDATCCVASTAPFRYCIRGAIPMGVVTAAMASLVAMGRVHDWPGILSVAAIAYATGYVVTSILRFVAFLSPTRPLFKMHASDRMRYVRTRFGTAAALSLGMVYDDQHSYATSDTHDFICDIADRTEKAVGLAGKEPRS